MSKTIERKQKDWLKKHYFILIETVAWDPKYSPKCCLNSMRPFAHIGCICVKNDMICFSCVPLTSDLCCWYMRQGHFIYLTYLLKSNRRGGSWGSGGCGRPVIGELGSLPYWRTLQHIDCNLSKLHPVLRHQCLSNMWMVAAHDEQVALCKIVTCTSVWMCVEMGEWLVRLQKVLCKCWPFTICNVKIHCSHSAKVDSFVIFKSCL